MEDYNSLKLENLQLKKQLRTYEELALKDSVSGLPNKNVFLEKLEEDVTFSAMMLSIDNFETIGETFGMKFSDSVVREISKLLNNFLSDNIYLYRLNSGEFVFLIEGKYNGRAEDIAQGIKSFFDIYPIEYDEIEIKVTFSIGICYCEKNVLLKNSRIAMNEARALGSNRYHYFSKDDSYIVNQEKNIYWMNKIHDALMSGNIVPFFQAIRDNVTGEIYKYECLVRILEGDKVITPWYFNDAVQMTGLMTNLTKTMIDKSFKVFSNRSEEFSINITQEDLKEAYLKSFLTHKCERYSIAPTRVTLEILEDIEESAAQTVYSQLTILKELGFQISIDDFGAQNSNFSRLLQMPVDYIKIDGQFIKNIETSIQSRHITEAIHSFAHKIGAKSIAEFVHNDEVLKIVKEIGIDYSQGYLISEPKSKPL